MIPRINRRAQHCGHNWRRCSPIPECGRVKMSRWRFLCRSSIGLLVGSTICPVAASAAPQALRVTHARLDSDAPDPGKTGRVLLRAIINDRGGEDTFANKLLSNSVTLRV